MNIQQDHSSLLYACKKRKVKDIKPSEYATKQIDC